MEGVFVLLTADGEDADQNLLGLRTVFWCNCHPRFSVPRQRAAKPVPPHCWWLRSLRFLQLFSPGLILLDKFIDARIAAGFLAGFIDPYRGPACSYEVSVLSIPDPFK